MSSDDEKLIPINKIGVADAGKTVSRFIDLFKLIIECENEFQVRVRGRLQKLRTLGKQIRFIILRQRTNTIQCVGSSGEFNFDIPIVSPSLVSLAIVIIVFIPSAFRSQ